MPGPVGVDSAFLVFAARKPRIGTVAAGDEYSSPPKLRFVVEFAAQVLCREIDTLHRLEQWDWEASPAIPSSGSTTWSTMMKMKRRATIDGIRTTICAAAGTMGLTRIATSFASWRATTPHQCHPSRNLHSRRR